MFVEDASTVTVGGETDGARNVLSAARYGVQISRSTACKVLGNRVGTDGSGRQAIGNDYSGITVSRSTETTVEGNLVAGSGN